MVRAGTAHRETSYGPLPISFEVNRDQTGSSIRFLARGGDSTLLLDPRGLTLVTYDPARRPDLGGSRLSTRAHRGQPTRTRITFVGANPRPEIVGLDQEPGRSNYFVGRDKRRWLTDIPTYAEVAYRNVYPGVDLRFYGHQGRLEYDWVVRPRADARRIRRDIQGAGVLHLDRAGNLVAGRQRIVQGPARTFQTASGRRRVGSGYVLMGPHRVGFNLGAYNTRHTLVIDPVLTYATLLAGYGEAIAVDGAGNAYVTGEVGCDAIPAIHAAQPAHSPDCANFNLFVQKLSPSGDSLLYSTYLGGNGPQYAGGIAVDAEGSAYVTGYTGAADYPIERAFQSDSDHGRQSAVVTKLAPIGDRLVYSTYLGAGEDEGNGIALDTTGAAYVVGGTRAADFPVVNAIQARNKSQDGNNAFVSKLDSTGGKLVYSTYLGGSSGDSGLGIAVDSQGSAYVAGDGGSPDFPVVHPLPMTTTHQPDGFAAKMADSTAPALPTATPPTGPTLPPATVSHPSPTPTSTPIPQNELERVWLNSMSAETALKSVHSSGTIADPSGKIRFNGDCANGLRIQAVGKDKKGRPAGVEYLSIGSGFWGRSRQANGRWGKWQKGPGYDADIFISLVTFLCPQALAQRYQSIPLPAVSSMVKSLGTTKVKGRSARHLRIAVQSEQIDIYVDPSIYYWLRVHHIDLKSHEKWNAIYSRFNKVHLTAPK